MTRPSKTAKGHARKSASRAGLDSAGSDTDASIPPAPSPGVLKGRGSKAHASTDFASADTSRIASSLNSDFDSFFFVDSVVLYVPFALLRAMAAR